MKDNLCIRLEALDACAVSDALDRIGHSGVALDLSQLSSVRRISGRVITVELLPDDGRPTKRHLGTAAVDASGPGDVIVVSHGARTEVAGWGGILSLGASVRGVAGIIIDGACRDLDEARDLDLPIYGRGGVARTARGRVIESGWNVPVVICGVPVSPGDYVIADGSGVVFIPSAMALEIVTSAEKIAAREAMMAAAVRRGDAISSVMGADYESMLQERSA